MTATATNDVLGTVTNSGYSVGWDWKGSYVDNLNSDGLERFSQFSASPDTTILFAGPCRFTGVTDTSTDLIPIGLVDNIAHQQNAQLMRLFEIGSNRSYFTRGKTAPTISMSKVLADQANILSALSQSAYRPAIDDSGASAPSASGSKIMMNLDSEYFSVPFGLMVVFKTRGTAPTGDGMGTPLACIYLEYCMFEGYSFQVASAQPVIAENIQIQYDRCIPVAFS